MLIMIPFCCVF